MKRVVLICCCMLFLTACFYSKEAKQVKNSKETQAEIETAIKKQAKEKYGMDVDVQMEKLKFTFPEGKVMFPIKTDKRLKVPVETVGSPVYEFKVRFNIYDEETETYQFNEDELELRKISGMGTVLLTDVYKELYEKEFNKILEFDEDIVLDIEAETKFSNRFFEDEAEEDALLKDFAKDYNEGRFADPLQYKYLIKKYAVLPSEDTLIYEEQLKGDPPCTPRISLSLKLDEDAEQTEVEKLDALIAFIKDDDTLPNGSYHIHVSKEVPNKKPNTVSAHELVLRCKG